MTREHIIPDFAYKFLKSVPLPMFGWSEKAGKIFGGEATIADVCKECNGGPLSKLDANGKAFLEKNGFLTKLYLKNKTNINFDYDLLLRWLMKVSYNSISAANDPSKIFYDKYREYILNGHPKPDPNSVMLFVGLTLPAKVLAEVSPEYSDLVSDDGYCAPFQFRITETNKDFLEKNICENAVVIGSVFFHIIIFDNAIVSKSLFKRVACEAMKMKYVKPNSSGMFLSNCGSTWVQKSQRQREREMLSDGYNETIKRISRKR